MLKQERMPRVVACHRCRRGYRAANGCLKRTAREVTKVKKLRVSNNVRRRSARLTWGLSPARSRQAVGNGRPSRAFSRSVTGRHKTPETRRRSGRHLFTGTSGLPARYANAAAAGIVAQQSARAGRATTYAAAARPDMVATSNIMKGNAQV